MEGYRNTHEQGLDLDIQADKEKGDTRNKLFHVGNRILLKLQLQNH